jgi:hypothetical protein
MACDAAGNLSLSYELFADIMQGEEPFRLLSVGKHKRIKVCDETDNLFCILSIEKTLGNVNT